MMKCKTNDWGCTYHACMSDDCQKKEVMEQKINWGPGKCEQEFLCSSCKFMGEYCPGNLFKNGQCDAYYKA